MSDKRPARDVGKSRSTTAGKLRIQDIGAVLASASSAPSRSFNLSLTDPGVAAFDGRITA
jgi:hypothetical protein